MAATRQPLNLDAPLQASGPFAGQRMATFVGAAVVLYVARVVFLPLAIAMLVAFALSPLVTRLRHAGMGMVVSVLIPVTAAFFAAALFAFVVFGQMAQLAENLPTFRDNIIQKINGLKAEGGESSLIARLSDMAAAVDAEVQKAMESVGGAAPPMPVEVIERTSVYDVMTGLVLPLLGPVGGAALVVILVVFMLLERDQLRERFIRLVGARDMHRTTEVLEEAGSRVATYLLTQLLVNVIYAVPIGLGLWLIGVPNAVLWGLLTLVLRFVPYIGPALSAAFPLSLAFAVSPGWSMMIWTAALFLAVEFVTSNVVEPWLYGSRTGISPLAVIIAAIFWTFLWGPLGLVLSTPLTVCLVVAGRHIPQFDLFDILFGDTPVLAPHARLYQRLLSNDRTEATFLAEEALESEGLVDFFQTSAIPALILANDDRVRGVLMRDKERRLAETASGMIADLAAIAGISEDGEKDEETAARHGSTPAWHVTTIGGRWEIDDCSAEILMHILAARGVATTARSFADLAPAQIGAGLLNDTDCVILCFLDPNPSRASLLHIRRLQRLEPHLRLGVVIWAMPATVPIEARGFHGVANVADAKLAEALEIGADFAVTTLEAACEAVLAAAKPKASRKARRRPAVSGKPAVSGNKE